MKFLFPLVGWLCLFAVTNRLSAAAATSSDGKDKLRALIRPPKVNLSVSLGIDNHTAGLSIIDPERAPTEAAEAEKALKADPDNGRLHLRFGDTLFETAETNRANEEWSRAIELLRPAAVASPEDGALQAALADALQSVDRLEEAEKVLRTALERSPKDWHCWKLLGSLLQTKAFRIVRTEGPKAPTKDSFKTMLAEAEKCVDHAIEVAPDQPDVYLSRVNFHGFNQTMREVLSEMVSDEAADSDTVLSINTVLSAYSRRSIEDCLQAARLEPTKPTPLAMAIWLDLMLSLKEAPMVNGKEDKRPLLERISEPSRKRIQESLAKLEKFTLDADPHQAARAFEIVGSFRVIIQDWTGAMPRLRQAVALDAGRYQAWDAMVTLLLEQGKYDDLVDICAKRVAVRNNVRNRLLYSKACLYANKPAEAVAQAELATKLDPKDLAPKLALMACHLRAAQTEEQMKAVEKEAYQLNISLLKVPWEGDSLRLHECSEMNRYIYLALTGETEEARDQLKRWIENVPDAEWAKEILAALSP